MLVILYANEDPIVPALIQWLDFRVPARGWIIQDFFFCLPKIIVYFVNGNTGMIDLSYRVVGLKRNPCSGSKAVLRLSPRVCALAEFNRLAII